MIPTCSDISETRCSISDVISNGGLYIPYKYSLMSDLLNFIIDFAITLIFIKCHSSMFLVSGYITMRTFSMLMAVRIFAIGADIPTTIYISYP